MRRREHEISVELLGPEHPKTLQSMTSLAVTVASQGHHAEAETLH